MDESLDRGPGADEPDIRADSEEPVEVLEEISMEAIEEALPAAEALAEEVEETLLETEALPEEAAIEEKPPQEVPALAMPDIQRLSDIFEEAANKKLSELLRGLDIKALLLEALMPTIKDSVESILWEVAPELTEKLIKEAIKGTMASLTKEMENVIWETVPEFAESIIRKEIENIRAGGA